MKSCTQKILRNDTCTQLLELMGMFSKVKGYKTKLKIRFLFKQSLAMLSQKPGNRSNKGEN